MSCLISASPPIRAKLYRAAKARENSVSRAGMGWKTLPGTGLSMEVGPFELSERIGEGAMGEVWRGRHALEDFPVAIKVITSSRATDPKYRRQFKNEVRSVASLNHPGIIRVLDYGEIDHSAAAGSGLRFQAGNPYLAMELADEGSLEDYRSELSWSRLRSILIGLLEALGHAHSRGIIHRDLKPSNVLLTENPAGELQLKLTDFGLAFDRDRLDRSTVERQEREAAGTPFYMAPEQFRSRWRDFGPWTDLYGLGCLTWRIVTGDYLVSGGSLLEVARRHLTQALPDFEPKITVPEEFQNWLARLLEKHPNDRFLTAADALWPLMRMPDRLGGTGMTRVEVKTAPTITRTEIAEPLESLADSLDGSSRSTPVNGPFGLDQTIPLHSEQAPRSIEPLERRRPPIPERWKQRRAERARMNLVGAGLELYNLREFPMVGRTEERNRLWKKLREVDATGEPNVVFLRGAAGVGKTRLARWVRERAVELGAATGLVATHSPESGPADGLAPMIERLMQTDGLDRADMTVRIERWYSSRSVEESYEWHAMAQFLINSSANTDASKPPEDQKDDIRRVQFSGATEIRALVRRFLTYAAKERPVVVQLDDLQWGLDTLHFLKHVFESARTDEIPVLFVGTIREDALAERPLEGRLVDELVEDGIAETLEVGALDEEERRFLVEKLLHLAPSAAIQIVERAGGNPLFAVELVRDWIERDVLKLSDRGFAIGDDVDGTVPDDLFDVWSNRLDKLLSDESEDARTALQLAAALGRDVHKDEWETACDIADLPTPQHLIDRLLRQNLLHKTDTGFRFPHGMLRETLTRDAEDSGRWQELNRACAEALQSRYSCETALPERLAHHRLASENASGAVEPLLEAIEQRGRAGSYEVAGRLVELLDDVVSPQHLAEEPELRLAIKLRRGRVLLNRDYELSQAERIFSEVLSEAERIQSDQKTSEALIALSGVHFEQQNYAKSASFADRARREIDYSERTEKAGRVEFRRGLAALFGGDLPTARKNFERAVGLLEETAPIETAKALHRWGTCELHRGNIGEAKSKLERALAVLDGHGSPTNRAHVANALGDCARHQESYSKALEWYSQAEQYVQFTGAIELSPFLLGRIQVHLDCERFEEARSRLETVSRFTEPGTHKYFDFAVLCFRAHAAAGLADWLTVRATVKQLKEITGENKPAVPDFAESLEASMVLAIDSAPEDLILTIGQFAAEIWTRLGDEERADRISAVLTDMN